MDKGETWPIPDVQKLKTQRVLTVRNPASKSDALLFFLLPILLFFYYHNPEQWLCVVSGREGSVRTEVARCFGRNILA
jgi:hypothetical protein